MVVDLSPSCGSAPNARNLRSYRDKLTTWGTSLHITPSRGGTAAGGGGQRRRREGAIFQAFSSPSRRGMSPQRQALPPALHGVGGADTGARPSIAKQCDEEEGS